MLGAGCAWIGTGGGGPVAHHGGRVGTSCPHSVRTENGVAMRRFAPFPTVPTPYNGYGVFIFVSSSLRGERVRRGESGMGTRRNGDAPEERDGSNPAARAEAAAGASVNGGGRHAQIDPLPVTIVLTWGGSGGFVPA